MSVCNRWVYMLFSYIEDEIVCPPFEKVNMQMHFRASGFPHFQADRCSELSTPLRCLPNVANTIFAGFL